MPRPTDTPHRWPNGESSESGSKREGLEDEGPNFEEEEEEAAPNGQQQQAVQVVDTNMDEPLGLGYRAAKRCSLEFTKLGAQGHDRDLRELYTRSRAVRDEIFSQRYWLRSLEQERSRKEQYGCMRQTLDDLERAMQES
ncbi:hypothetical protein Tco_0489754 [Tanacetum coccineum]